MNSKTWAKMTTSRIKLLRNKRDALVRQMRRDVALLLESGQHATARIRVEHVIREQNIMAANEIIELFCEHIVVRLLIISKQRDCPPDLKEAISSLIFAASRCSDIPELLAIKDIFQKKYGKDFVSAAADLRPDSGVSRLLIEKLSARNPRGEVKLKVMKEIAKEYQVEWDTAETEQELLQPLDEPLNLSTAQPVESKMSSSAAAAAAARAAAQSAKEAIAAAEAAAQLAKTETQRPTLLSDNNKSSGEDNSFDHGSNVSTCQRYSDIKFDESDCDDGLEVERPMQKVVNGGKAEDQVSRVHPKLPDYDTLAARFEALNYQKPHF